MQYTIKTARSLRTPRAVLVQLSNSLDTATVLALTNNRNTPKEALDNIVRNINHSSSNTSTKAILRGV